MARAHPGAGLSRPVRVLVVGWASVLHGEATAGDVLSMRAVAQALAAAGVAVEVAWSRVMSPLMSPVMSPVMSPLMGPAMSPGVSAGVVPGGGVALAEADPARYSHVVWVCGPLHGRAVREVVDRFAGRVLLAAGVSVVDPGDPVLAAFDTVLARDAPGREPARDLAAAPAAALVAALGTRGRASGASGASGGHDGDGARGVLGVVLAPGQGEYGPRRRHEGVHAVLGEWLRTSGWARVGVDTRLNPREWRSPSTAEEVLAVLGRCDAVVSTRLHGLVLALAAGVPVLAVDPVAGGGKVSAQARAWGWPALLGAEDLLGEGPVLLQGALAWCASPTGRAAAARAAGEASSAGGEDLARLLALVTG